MTIIIFRRLTPVKVQLVQCPEARSARADPRGKRAGGRGDRAGIVPWCSARYCSVLIARHAWTATLITSVIRWMTIRGLIARLVVPSCRRAWLHLASLVEERGDLPGYLLEFVDLAVGGDELRE